MLQGCLALLYQYLGEMVFGHKSVEGAELRRYDVGCCKLTLIIMRGDVELESAWANYLDSILNNCSFSNPVYIIHAPTEIAYCYSKVRIAFSRYRHRHRTLQGQSSDS